jgi:phosphohistidine phosphatase SixA
MRTLGALILLGLAWEASADERLWTRIKMDSNIVVLTRHMQSFGGKPLVWDESGECKGEARLTPRGRADSRTLGEQFSARSIEAFVISSPMCRCLETATIAFGEALADPDLREIASADTGRLRAFDRKATSLLLQHRGRRPIVFVSHRPNIELLTLELVDEGELVIGKISDSGEVEVLGKMWLPR